MASLYDGYRLSNSSQIKKFQGSTVPELMQLGTQLQQQYDTGRQYDDITSEMIPNTSALPEDRQLLQGLRDKYTGRISERASKGDYEHMWRDTMMDAKHFVNEYKPIAENQQRFSAYQKDLQDKLDKGYIKSPETVKKLIAASRTGYKGLQKDPITGEYTNQFQGMDAAKEINVTEWVDKALDHFAPQTIGGTVRKIEGEYYVTRGSRTVKLEQPEIDKVLNAAKNLDPEWQAYAKQKATLDTVGMENLTPSQVQKYFGTGTAAQLEGVANKSGKTIGEVAKMYAQESVLRDLDNNVRQYSSKFQRNDRDTDFAINGMTEEAAARVRKKVEDEVPVLAAQILQPIGGTTYADPVSLSAAKTASTQTAVEMDNKFLEYKNTLKKVGNKYLDADGNDRTEHVQKQQDMVAQAKRQAHDLALRETRAKMIADYKVEPALEKKANEVYTKTIEAYKNRDKSGPGYVYISDEQIKAKAQENYNNIIQSTPGYKRYKEVLEADAKKGSALIGLQTFGTKSSNDQAKSIFENLSQDMGINGLQGLTWGSGEKANKPLEADDYEKIKSNTEFAGVGIDTDGQYKFFYKVGKLDAKGKGEPVIVKMPALSGTAETLIKNKQITEAQQFVHQSVATQLSGTENKSARIKVGQAKDAYVDVQKVLPSGQGANGIDNSQYIVKFPLKGGTYKTVPVNTLAEVTDTIIETLKAH